MSLLSAGINPISPISPLAGNIPNIAKMGELIVEIPSAIPSLSGLEVLRSSTFKAKPPLPPPPPPRPIYPLANATTTNHTMGASLTRYLAIKVHQAVLAQSYNRIIITGAYNRYSSRSIPFTLEKTDKPFNWERPTARHDVQTNTLYIECFPGLDHLSHYAEIIATYLALLSREDLTPPSAVCYIPTSPSDTQLALREGTNLADFPGEGVHTVILGLVWHLPSLVGSDEWSPGQGESAPWQWVIKTFPSSSPSPNNTRSEKKKNPRTVAFLGFRPAFWGCISGEVIHFLGARFRSIKEVIYLGKLGTLDPNLQPNRWLATGSSSILHDGQHQTGAVVQWKSVLDDAVERKGKDCTAVGRHITLGSVLHETKEWWEKMHGRADFVDPEIGMMAQAAVRCGLGFGYLHMVTDNLGKKYEEDLSNEREEGVLKGRERLHRVVEEVIGDYVRSGC